MDTSKKPPLVSTQTKDPWAPTQPYLQNLLPATAELVDTDTGYKPYSGPTSAAMDGRSIDALNSAETIARVGDSFGANAYNSLANVTANQGLNSGLLNAAGSLQGVANSGGLGTDPLYQDTYARAGQNGDLEGFYDSMRQQNPFGGVANHFAGLGDHAGSMNGDAITTAQGISNGQNGITTGGQFQSAANEIPGQNRDSLNALNYYTANDGITTGGQFQSAANRIPGQNADALGLLGTLRSSDPITTGGGLQGLADKAGVQNRDVDTTFSEFRTRDPITTGGQFDQVYNAAGAPSAADSYLTQMASGEEGIDPRLNRMFDDNAERIGNKSASLLSASGRFGPNAAFADMLGRNITAANDPIAFAASEAAKGRQLGATSQIDAARNALGNQRINAAQGRTGAEAQNAGIRLNAAGQQAGMRQADTSLQRGLLGDISNVQGQNAQLRAGFAGQEAGIRQNDTAQAMSALQSLSNVQGQNASQRIGAASSAAGIRQGDTGQKLSALGQATNVEGQNISNKLSGTGLLAGLRNTNLGNQFTALQGQQGAIGNDIESQMAAAASQGGLRTADQATRLQAAQGLTNARNAGTGNAINAATQAGNVYGQGLNRGITAAGMAPEAYANLFTPSQMLSGVGDAYQGQEQNQINDLINYWNASEARPWEQLARANGIFSGLGTIGGSTVNTKPDTSPATWQKVLGGSVAAGGLLSKFV